MKYPADDDTKVARDGSECARAREITSLGERLLYIAKNCATHLKEPFRSADHGDSLYDQIGLPADR